MHKTLTTFNLALFDFLAFPAKRPNLSKSKFNTKLVEYFAVKCNKGSAMMSENLTKPVVSNLKPVDSEHSLILL